jgi:RNA polymerase sigma-70 factor (sigma-E family)
MRADDERDFREFVAVRLPALRRSAYLLCGSRHGADDLVSIAIGKLFRVWRRVSRLENPDAYLRRMLVNGWLDERRRPWRREHSRAEPPEPAGGAVPPPDRDVTERLTLMAVLDRLPARRRAVLVLRYFDDLSVEQTAEILGMSTGTVKTHTARGLADLRVLLDGAASPVSGRAEEEHRP